MQGLHRYAGRLRGLLPGSLYAPIFWMLSIVTIVIVFAIFGGRIFMWDFEIVYGRVLKKLEELITDMEDLRN